MRRFQQIFIMGLLGLFIVAFSGCVLNQQNMISGNYSGYYSSF